MTRVIGQEAQIGDVGIAMLRDDFAVASSALAAQVSGLSVGVDAGATYIVEAFIPFALAGTASGYKFSIFGPTLAAAQLRETVEDATNKAIVGDVHVTTYSGVAGALAAIGTHTFRMNGMIKISTTGGFFHIRAAQNTSDAGAITLKTGAWLRLTRVG